MLYYRAMADGSQYKRTQYLVDTGFQIRFVTRLFAVVLAIAIVSSVLATTLLWGNMYRPDLGLRSHLTAALIAIAVTLLIELLLAIPIVFYLGVRQSHRIVGPISRIKRMLEAIGRGDYSQRITLREGDVLDDLAKAINQMAEQLEQRSPKKSA
jgi:methyl-accepting chemotaxis protein